MSADLTTQMLKPSLRRVYTSRAFLMAIPASGACRLPTCLWASPCWLRMKTSHSGHSCLVMNVAPFLPFPLEGGEGKFGFASSDSLRFPRWLLLRIRERCLSDPRALL